MSSSQTVTRPIPAPASYDALNRMMNNSRVAYRDTPAPTTVSTAPIRAEQLLAVRRAADHDIKNTLWGTLNITQENLMKGGLYGHNANGGRTSTREIKSVDTDLRINKTLWTMLITHQRAPHCGARLLPNEVIHNG